MISSQTLTEEQRLLVDSAENFLSQNCNSRSDAGEDVLLWQQMLDLGWAAVHIPEEYGGLGLGLFELGLLQQLMGKYLFRSPFFTSVVLVQTLLLEAAREEVKESLLPALVEGAQSGTLIFNKGLCPQDGKPYVKAVRNKDGWTLSGLAEQVLDSEVDLFALVVAELEEGDSGLFYVPVNTPGVSKSVLKVWDLTRPQSTWNFEDVQLSSDARIDKPGVFYSLSEALGRCSAFYAVMLAAEQLGGASRCLELTLQYTLERHQFNRSIASFQAVKHRCAEMLVEIEKSKSALEGVLSELTSSSTSELTQCAAITRIQSSECYRFCASEAIQLHGGVGFTWEYDPQLHFKRAQWGSQWFGTDDTWRALLVNQLIGE